MAILLALAGGTFLALHRGDRTPYPQASGPPPFYVPELDAEPRAAAPSPAVTGSAQWVDAVADRTNIPGRTLRAYLGAEAHMRTAKPGCHLSWATLAGVGRIESQHGRHGGTKVLDDGTLSQPIIGIPLDGSPGVKAIKDTDGGELDGDPVWDRALGSMQFLPTTWHKWAVRANGDGRPADPQNVDDAALASARYLCGAGGDLSTGKGWWDAVLTYNESVRYGRDVFDGADAYGRVSTDLI